MKRTAFLVLVLALLVIAGIRLLDTPEPTPVIPVPVRTVEVTEESHPLEITYLGRVAAESLLYASFETGGKIEAIPAEEGQQVLSGQSLALLDRSDLADERARAEAAYRAAEAEYLRARSGTRSETIRQALSQLDKAQKARDYAAEQLEKSRTLYEAGALSRDGLDQATLQDDLARADLDAARARYDEARAGAEAEQIEAARQQMLAAKSAFDLVARTYDEADLVAPFNGRVLEVRFNPGERVGPGIPVVILRREQTIVDLGITAEDLNLLEEGMTATVDDRPGGRLIQLIDVPDPAHGLYRAEVQLEDDRYRVGEVVSVSLTVGTVDGVLLPITALVDRGLTGVYTVVEDHAVFRPLDLLATRGDQVIVSGLSEGESVVIENMTRLSEGDPVEVK